MVGVGELGGADLPHVVVEQFRAGLVGQQVPRRGVELVHQASLAGLGGGLSALHDLVVEHSGPRRAALADEEPDGAHVRGHVGRAAAVDDRVVEPPGRGDVLLPQVLRHRRHQQRAVQAALVAERGAAVTGGAEEGEGGRDQRAGGVPERHRDVERVPVQERVETVVHTLLDGVGLADELFLARAAEQFDPGLETARPDRLGDGDRGGGPARAQRVVGVTVAGAVRGAVGVVVVDEGVVAAHTLLLGQAGQRVVLGVEAEDGSLRTVGRDEGGREAARTPLDGEAVVLQQSGVGEGGLPLAQRQLRVLPHLVAQLRDRGLVGRDPVERGLLGGGVPRQPLGGLVRGRGDPGLLVVPERRGEHRVGLEEGRGGRGGTQPEHLQQASAAGVEVVHVSLVLGV